MHPLPDDEQDRLAALHSYAILDPPLGALYEAVPRLAAALCQTPMAVLGLMDGDRLRIKASVGLDGLVAMSRSDAFCAYTILSDRLLEIPDATADERFASNPMVVGPPYIRFYAGMPIVNPEGHVLGTVAVLDTQPRRLAPLQRDALAEKAGWVMALIESGRSERARLEQARGQLSRITDNIPIPVAFVGVDQRYRFSNRAYAKWFGVDHEDISGMTVREVIGEDTYALDRPHIEDCLRGLGSNVEYRSPRADRRGAAFVRVDFVPERDPTGMLVGFYTLVHDISDQKSLEAALYAEKERAEVTLRAIGDGVITVDTAGRVTYVNPTAESMTGWTYEEARGQPVEAVFRALDTLTGEPAPNPATAVLRANRPAPHAINKILMRRDGGKAAIEDSAATIRDPAGNVTGAVLVFHDVTEARAMAMRMTHLAHHDQLTNLPNRVLLRDRIQQAIAQAKRHRVQVALLYIDLDGFKHVNDSLGHPVGDKLLRQVAERLTACVRSTDTVCRQGGDEFVILLPEIDQPSRAGQIAEKLVNAGAAMYRIDGHELHVSFSIGISIFPDNGNDVDVLMRNADAALYHAKENGRNNFQFFAPEMNSRAGERLSLQSGLHGALDRSEFRLYYQPKINLKTGSVIGAEALIRWQRPGRGMVLPNQFISVAEDSGLILAIGAWVLYEACRQNRAWQDASLSPVPVSVNISPTQFRQKNFLQTVLRTLDQTGLDPRYLELELTESVIMRDVEHTGAVLRTLKELGVQVSIDDFGTGYSSLSYLKRLPIDTLKIDQSFIRDIAYDPDDAAIISAVINMAKSLRQKVIAEGVETQEQAAFLQRQQCDEMQGYYFCEPLPASEFPRVLRDSRQAVLPIA